jgi:HSP20 family protein
MDKAVRKNPETAPEAAAGQKGRRQTTLRPPVTVYEADDHVVVELEMPGVEKDKIDVTVDRDELTVVGWRKGDEETGEYLHRERPTGCFRRSFVLGEDIDASRIAAAYENGVLKLTLAKAEAAKPKRITIS